MAILEHYNSFDDKEAFYIVQKITAKEEVKKLIEQLSPNNERGDFIWRGLSESKFKHYTSLQRFWIERDLGDNEDEIHKYINHSYESARNWNDGLLPKYFERLKIPYFPVTAALSILRHHGAPTPIIDWTRDPLVGLFFAAKFASIGQNNNELDNFFSLYRLDTEHPHCKFSRKTNMVEFNESSHRIELKIPKKEKNELQDLLSTHANDFKKFTEGHPISIVEDKQEDLLNYFILNNYRIINQKGLFLINIYPNKPLAEAFFHRMEEIGAKFNQTISEIERVKNDNKKLFKVYEIHKKLKEYVLSELNKKGINEDFLFPDLDKIAMEATRKFLVDDDTL